MSPRSLGSRSRHFGVPSARLETGTHTLGVKVGDSLGRAPGIDEYALQASGTPAFFHWEVELV